MHCPGLGQGNKMRHINLFGAHLRAGPGRMATADSFVTVENLQPLLLVFFTRVHQADNRRQHRIGAQKTVMAADAGASAAKAIYTARRFNILLKLLRRDIVGITVRDGQRVDDVWLYPIQFFISRCDVDGQVPYDRGHLDGVNGKGGRLEIPHGGFNEQFAGQQGFTVDADRTGAALAVFAGRVPGQRGILRAVDLSEKIDEALDAAGFNSIAPAAGSLCLGVESINFQCQGIGLAFLHGFESRSGRLHQYFLWIRPNFS